MSNFLKGVITEPQNLFGRNSKNGLLEKIHGHIHRFNNIQIVGERRFGKTSVLRCLETKLKSEERFIPVFIDLKEYSFVKGNANVYRFILARSVQELSKRGLLNDEIVLKGILFKKHTDWEDFYEVLLTVADYRMNDILKEFYSFFSEYYSKTFVLLIDEYEHLFLYSFEDPKGFFLFRNIGQSQIEGDIVPLCFIIAGTMTWDKICTITGSAELNTLSSEIIYVAPLKFESFNEWYNMRLLTILSEPKIAPSKLYYLAGGVPFYALVIIESLKLGTSLTFNILFPHFEEVYRNLDDKERRLLNSIIRKENFDKHIYTAQILLNKGLIKAEKKNVIIASSLFNDFLFSKLSLKELVEDNDQAKLYQIISNIFRTMAGINETCENKNKKHIFKPVNQDPFLQNDLQIKCVDSDDIKRFAGAVYLTVFEKTKENNKPLFLLPAKFQMGNDFVKTVDSLRHFFGGHLKDTFTVRPGQLSKSNLLIKILNSPNNPNDTDYLDIQKYILNSFMNYLQEIDLYIKEPKNTSHW